jgi:hypothetical protein
VTEGAHSLRLISALTALWNAIRERHASVPAVVLLPAPSLTRKMNVLGHFAPLRWKVTKANDQPWLHEVVVVAEHLDRGAEDILETLLHESAHAMNFARGIGDCSRSQYHNERFKEAAEELGLEVQRIPNYGWARTSLAPGTAERYRVGVAELRAVLIHRHRKVVLAGTTNGGTTTTPEDEGGPRSRHLKATCACPLVIRVSKKTLEKTTIRCESCDAPFRVSP